MVDRASNDRPGQHPSGTAANTQEAAAAFAQTRAQGGPSNAERRSSHNGPEVGSRRSGASASGGQQNVQTALESAVQQRDRDGERRQGDDRDRTEMMRRSQDAVGRRQVAPFVPQGSSTIEALALGGSVEPSAHRDIENMSRDEARDFLLGVVRPNLQAGLAQAAQVQLPQAPPPVGASQRSPEHLRTWTGNILRIGLRQALNTGLSQATREGLAIPADIALSALSPQARSAISLTIAAVIGAGLVGEAINREIRGLATRQSRVGDIGGILGLGTGITVATAMRTTDQVATVMAKYGFNAIMRDSMNAFLNYNTNLPENAPFSFVDSAINSAGYFPNQYAVYSAQTTPGSHSGTNRALSAGQTPLQRAGAALGYGQAGAFGEALYDVVELTLGARRAGTMRRDPQTGGEVNTGPGSAGVANLRVTLNPHVPNFEEWFGVVRNVMTTRAALLATYALLAPSMDAATSATFREIRTNDTVANLFAAAVVGAMAFFLFNCRISINGGPEVEAALRQEEEATSAAPEPIHQQTATAQTSPGPQAQSSTAVELDLPADIQGTVDNMPSVEESLAQLPSVAHLPDPGAVRNSAEVEQAQSTMERLALAPSVAGLSDPGATRDPESARQVRGNQFQPS